MSNPYAPPEHDNDAAPILHEPSADGSVVGTATLTEGDMVTGLALANKRARWYLPVVCAFSGFVVTSFGGITVQIIAAPIAGALGWLLWRNLFRSGARRSLAGKTDRERTVTWRFTPETVEITTVTTYTRMQWSTVHRCLEGGDVFALYTSEAIVQIIPKRAFRAEEIETLRGMFASLVTPRKRPSAIGRMLVLWMVLVLAFLAVWQFMQDVRPQP
jgi:hypothetical protein